MLNRFVRLAIIGLILGSSARDAGAQGCGYCQSERNETYNYWFHYFPPFAFDYMGCSADGGCHPTASAQQCGYYHWSCASFEFKTPQGAFDALRTVLAKSDVQAAARLILANSSQFTLNDTRGVVQIRGCDRQVVAQVALMGSQHLALRAALATGASTHALAAPALQFSVNGVLEMGAVPPARQARAPSQ